MGNSENLKDGVDLCYKALGLSFSDPPERIEVVYRNLKDKFTREIHSKDPAARKNASIELSQLEALYKTISESHVYRDYAREYEKKGHIREIVKQEKLQKKQTERSVLIACGYCNRLYPRYSKTCPYCRKKRPLSLAAKVVIVMTTIIFMMMVGGVVLFLFR